MTKQQISAAMMPVFVDALIRNMRLLADHGATRAELNAEAAIMVDDWNKACQKMAEEMLA